MIRTRLPMMSAAIVMALLMACAETPVEVTPSPTSTPTPSPTPTATPTPTPTPSPTATPTPVPSRTPEALADEAPAVGTEVDGGEPTESPAQALLLDSAAAMLESGSFHFSLDGELRLGEEDDDSGIPITFEGDVVFPDRMRGKLTVSLGFFALEFEGIVIGDTAYMTDLETGEWVVGAGVVGVLPDPLEIVKIGAASLGADVAVVEATLGGTSTNHIQGVPLGSLFGGADIDARLDIWLGADDNLVRQVVGEGGLSAEEAGGALDAIGVTGQARIVMTMTFSNYGEPVVIQAPLTD